MPQTRTNELNLKVLSKEESHLVKGGIIRSDRLPPMPKNVYFGQIEVLGKPEPIKKRPNAK